MFTDYFYTSFSFNGVFTDVKITCDSSSDEAHNIVDAAFYSHWSLCF